MSKGYTLAAVVNGDCKYFNKIFKSRQAAINYVYKYFESICFYNTQVEEEIYKSKHDVEYVMSDDNRFIVNRIVLA